jgi:hypothetical protein
MSTLDAICGRFQKRFLNLTTWNNGKICTVQAVSPAIVAQ